MKKVFKIEVDCALCANKCEEAIKKVPNVLDCQINFITQKMTKCKLYKYFSFRIILDIILDFRLSYFFNYIYQKFHIIYFWQCNFIPEKRCIQFCNKLYQKFDLIFDFRYNHGYQI